MLKYNSLQNIFKDFIERDELDDEEPYYDVGERTIYVLDVVMEVCVQFEIQDIEEMLLLGGFSGEYRIEMDVLKADCSTIEMRVYDLIMIKIPRSSSATGYSDGKQRLFIE